MYSLDLSPICAVQELMAAHKAELVRVRQEEAANAQVLVEEARAELHAEHLKAVLGAEKGSAEAMQELRQQHRAELQRREEGHAARVAAVRGEYDSTISDLQRSVKEMRGAAEASVRQLEAKLSQTETQAKTEATEQERALQASREETIAARRLAKVGACVCSPKFEVEVATASPVRTRPDQREAKVGLWVCRY